MLTQSETNKNNLTLSKLINRPLNWGLFNYTLNIKINVKITRTMMIQIVRLVNNCFNLELELKKAGSTNNKTPTIYITGSAWSIKVFSY